MAIPKALRHGPFTVAEAWNVGVSWAALQTPQYRRLTRGIYASSRLANDPALMFRAILRRLPPQAVLSGLSAGWAHGLDVAPCAPVQVTLPPKCRTARRSGVWIRHSPLADGEIVLRRGFRTTSSLRTLLDLGRTLPLVDAVVVADLALHARLLDFATVSMAVEACAGTWNVKRLRRVVELAEPLSESPMESKLRIMLVQAGLPRPQAQVELCDRHGQLLGRADLYYPSHRLAIEYDGGSHRDSLVRDNRRQNAILAAGYKVRRFTAPDVLERPDMVIAQIRGELTTSALAA